jgi:hypothetical protein
MINTVPNSNNMHHIAPNNESCVRLVRIARGDVRDKRHFRRNAANSDEERACTRVVCSCGMGCGIQVRGQQKLIGDAGFRESRESIFSAYESDTDIV